MQGKNKQSKKIICTCLIFATMLPIFAAPLSVTAEPVMACPVCSGTLVYETAKDGIWYATKEVSCTKKYQYGTDLLWEKADMAYVCDDCGFGFPLGEVTASRSDCHGYLPTLEN
jgi:uncharacterized protein YbaR (Trm112 family)